MKSTSGGIMRSTTVSSVEKSPGSVKYRGRELACASSTCQRLQRRLGSPAPAASTPADAAQRKCLHESAIFIETPNQEPACPRAMPAAEVLHSHREAKLVPRANNVRRKRYAATAKNIRKR